jgi:hypothetical protein
MFFSKNGLLGVSRAMRSEVHNNSTMAGNTPKAPAPRTQTGRHSAGRTNDADMMNTSCRREGYNGAGGAPRWLEPAGRVSRPRQARRSL